jgi:hypothetical protein
MVRPSKFGTITVWSRGSQEVRQRNRPPQLAASLLVRIASSATFKILGTLAHLRLLLGLLKLSSRFTNEAIICALATDNSAGNEGPPVWNKRRAFADRISIGR